MPVIYPALIPVVVSVSPVSVVNDELISYLIAPPPPTPLTGLNGVTAVPTCHDSTAESSIAPKIVASATVILNEPVPVPPSLSVTVTVYVVFTLLVGVPEI